MRKTIKFLHTMAAVGFIGALAALVVLHVSLPDAGELQRFAALRTAQGAVVSWILLPSMGLVLVSGLFSLAAVPAYQDAGWAWMKLLSGILVFEGTLVYVQAPMERAARRARAALEGELSAAELTTTLQPEWASFWIIGAVAVANVALGVWRPRLSWRWWIRDEEGPSPTATAGAGAGSADAPATRGEPSE